MKNNILIGDYILKIDHKKNFANAYFEARKQPAEDFDAICLLLDRELGITHYRQNKNGIQGAGKRVWGKLQEKELLKLEVIANNYNHALVPPDILPQEILKPVDYLEESTTLISINAYESDQLARKICIEHHGSHCSVCNFDYFEVYGELGKDYIDVHHIVPLPGPDNEYDLNAIEDLRPVCSNCHSMLHRHSPPMSIEELSRILHGDSNEVISASQQFYLDFWPELLSELFLDDSSQPYPKTTGKIGNIFFPMTPPAQCWITVYFLQQKGHVGVYLTFLVGAYANHVYSMLLSEKDVIENELEIDAAWESKDGKHTICTYKSYDNLMDESNRYDIKSFLRDAINRYVNVFRPRLTKIADD